MRKQIKGLNQASANAQDGISCVQTAEGALAEVEDMLQRMNQLSVQASNGTNSEADRQNIQDEIDQLVTEIDRVSETTKFNEIYLLKGDPKGGKQALGQYNYANKAGVVSGITLKSGAADTFYTLNKDGSRKYITADNAHDYIEFNASTSAFKVKDGVTIYKQTNGVNTKVTNMDDVVKADTTSPVVLYDEDGKRISENGLAAIMNGKDADKANEKLFLETGQSLKEMGKDMAAVASDYVSVTTAAYADDLQLTFHVGSEGAGDNKIDIDIKTMDSVNLGVDVLKSDKNGIVDDDGQSATDAIKVIADAINKVSSQRSALGAIQNRLEHTINNLDNIAENTTAAESAIRDTDMATTMVEYSNKNILAQAGQSMLAQANQSNQGVLSLLG
jgi:flagellin